MSRGRIDYIAITILEATSIPLTILALLMILSGYAIVEPYTVSKLTIDTITLDTAYKIHTDPVIRISFTILLIIHTITGLTIIINRRIKYRILNTIIKTIIIVVATYILYIALVIEYITP